MKSIKPAMLALLLFQIITPAQKKEIIAYYPEWGTPEQRYFVKNLETTGSAKKLTIINYAFAIPAPDSAGKIVLKLMNAYADYQQPYTAENSVDGIADDPMQLLKGEFNQLRKLKKMHPQLKLVLSIGGWTGSNYFSDAALTPESREAFVNDCINKFILGNLPKENNSGGLQSAKGLFDGFDIDWEFPVEGGVPEMHHNLNDRDNLSLLFSLFRKKIDEVKSGLLLTAAVPAGTNNAWKFNFNKDQKAVDWFNLMTYDYHGSWDTVTAHHTNLLGTPNSFMTTIKFFIDSLGVKPDKLVPGAAFYGRGWKVNDTSNFGLYRPGIVANGLLESGFNNFGDLQKFMKRGYMLRWDDTVMAPYMFNPAERLFWTLDDTKSIALKVHAVKAYKLRGIMFWDISGDDSAGTLVNTIYSGNMPDLKISKKEINENKEPIEITSPLTSENIIPGSDVIIKTNALTEDAVKKVEFFCNNKSIGYSTSAPFNWVWFNAPAGKNKLKAVATYNDLKKKTSKSIIVNVKRINS